MDVAWLARWEEDLLVLQVLDGDAASFGLAPGVTIKRDRGLYDRFLTGELPSVVPDTELEASAAREPLIGQLGLRSYAVAGVVDNDGVVYGMIGCAAHQPRPALRQRDGRFLGLLASFLSDFVIDLQNLWETRSEVSRGIAELIDAGGPMIVYQPIVDLAAHTVVGLEALSRFPRADQGPVRVPEGWYADAHAVGLGTELELAAVGRALAALPDIPPGVTLAVNASPTTISAGLVDLVAGVATRVAVEITEHEYFTADRAVMRGLDALREQGVRIAADDIGTGYAGLEQLLHLRPDIIKLDRVITRGIDADPARQTIAAGLVQIAREIGGSTVAEGIETPGELEAVRAAGIPYGQGYFFGVPIPSPVEACQPGRV